MAHVPSILVVDDTNENLKLLFNCLNQQGYAVMIAKDGATALDIVANYSPDLILLDIMMGGMDGFEVCHRLKEHPQWRKIPVIFITALTDATQQLKGFEVGGVDYITKPFQFENVLARINTHLKLAQTQRELAEKNAQLIELNQEKNEFLSIAAHDLKNPLIAILGMTSLLNMDLDTGNREVLKDYIDSIETSANKMFTLITNLLDVNAIESGSLIIDLEMVTLLPLLDKVLSDYQQRAANKNIHLSFNTQHHELILIANTNTLHQVLDNLISNALKYSPIGSQVLISLVKSGAEHAQIRIKDEGPGFTVQDQKQLFTKFARLSAKPTGSEHSTGLGLFIVKKLMDAMGGQIYCESEVGHGATFILELPCAKHSTDSKQSV